MNKKAFLGKILVLVFLLGVTFAFYLIYKINPNTEIIRSSPPDNSYENKISSGSTLEDTNINNKTNSSNINQTNYTTNSKIIEDGDLIMIDIWARLNTEGAPFADITWMAYNGKEIPKEIISEAKEICREIDINDTIFVASSIFLNSFLWTGDKKLEIGLLNKKFVKIIKTSELLKEDLIN